MLLHELLKTGPMLSALGFPAQKVINVTGIAKGTHSQNREFFRCLAEAFIRSFHRVVEAKAQRTFDIVRQYAEWTAWLKEKAETRETLKFTLCAVRWVSIFTACHSPIFQHRLPTRNY